MASGLPMTRPDSWWWCTRRVAKDCLVMVPAKPNCPDGYMCRPCRAEVHRYDVAKNEGKDVSRFGHVLRTMHRSNHGGRSGGEKRQVVNKKKCSCCGTRHVWHEFRFLCRECWLYGEDRVVMW